MALQMAATLLGSSVFVLSLVVPFFFFSNDKFYQG